MNKIPTLYVRNPDDRRHLLTCLTPGCEWVMAGEGRATRKYDGTCVAFDGTSWWARRELKPGQVEPRGWEFVAHDPDTDKRVGWEPIENTGWAKWHAEAVGLYPHADGGWEPGTYELCGPKVNGNPEEFYRHQLIPHARAERYSQLDRPMSYDHLSIVVPMLPWEGIVWHHPDGRMAKLKRWDFT